jgi:hypothetical protein
VLVSRGSQVHHTPHALRAQSGPVIRPAIQNIIPTSAAETATASKRASPLAKYTALHTEQTMNPRYMPFQLAMWK